MSSTPTKEEELDLRSVGAPRVSTSPRFPNSTSPVGSTTLRDASKFPSQRKGGEFFGQGQQQNFTPRKHQQHRPPPLVANDNALAEGLAKQSVVYQEPPGGVVDVDFNDAQHSVSRPNDPHHRQAMNVLGGLKQKRGGESTRRTTWIVFGITFTVAFSILLLLFGMMTRQSNAPNQPHLRPITRLTKHLHPGGKHQPVGDAPGEVPVHLTRMKDHLPTTGGSLHSDHDALVKSRKHGVAKSKSSLNLVLEGDGFPKEEDILRENFGQVSLIVSSRSPFLPWGPIRQILRSYEAHRRQVSGKVEAGSDGPYSFKSVTDSIFTRKSMGIPKDIDEAITGSLRVDGHGVYHKGVEQHLYPPFFLRSVQVVVSVLSDQVTADQTKEGAALIEAAVAAIDKAYPAPAADATPPPPGHTTHNIQWVGVTTTRVEGVAVGSIINDPHAPRISPGVGAMFNAGVEAATSHSSHVLFLTEAHTFSDDPFTAVDAQLNVFYQHAPPTHDENSDDDAAGHVRIAAVQGNMVEQRASCFEDSGLHASTGKKLQSLQRNDRASMIEKRTGGSRRAKERRQELDAQLEHERHYEEQETLVDDKKKTELEKAKQRSAERNGKLPDGSEHQQRAALSTAAPKKEQQPVPPQMSVPDIITHQIHSGKNGIHEYMCLGDRTVVDKGFHIGLGTERFQSKAFVVRRMMGVSYRDNRLQEVERIDFASPFGLLVDLRKFIRVGGFPEVPTLIDRVVSGSVDMTAVVKCSNLVKFRIFAVERIMESISLNEVHASGMELRQLVRSTYAEVVEATGVWEEITQSTLDVQSYDFEGTELEKSEKEETKHFNDMTTIERLKAVAARLHDSVTALRSAGKHRDTASAEEQVGWEISVRFRDSDLFVYSANSTYVVHKPLLPPKFSEFLATNTMDLYYPSYALSGSFEHEWSPSLKRWFGSHNDEAGHSPVRVIWDTICCGCCGFSSEIVNFVYPLEKRRMVQILPNHKQCFCSGYSSAIADTIQRIHITPDQYVLQKQSRSEISVWIAHTDPMAYKTNLQNRRVPDYIVGRSMYEFSRIGQNWVSHMKHADEVWVPAEFVRRLFMDSGVSENKLVIMPEATDTNFFDPAIHPKMPLPLEGQAKETWIHFCNKDAPKPTAQHPHIFKFFSNFKWEPRKGWEILMEAWYRAFKDSDEPVSLYVLSYIFLGPHYQGDIHNVTHIKLELESFLDTERMGHIKLEDMPHFCIITETIEENHMAILYNSVDAFVLPTRGEGWGLPAIQSMSMGKPTISTNWGGNTEFMKSHNSFLIPIDGVDEVPQSSPYGWERSKKWAVPSMNGTAKLIRYVYDNQEFAKKIGLRGRRYVQQRFSLDAVAELTDSRLREIRKIVIERRKNKNKNK